MRISEQITQLKQDFDEVYDAGYQEGITVGGGAVNPTPYIADLNSLFQSAEFPINYDLVLEVNKLLVSVAGTTNASNVFYLSQNLRTVKLINKSNVDAPIIVSNLIRGCASLESVDLTEFNRSFANAAQFANAANKLTAIYGELDCSLCTTFSTWLGGCAELTELQIKEGTINIDVSFEWCVKLSKTSLTSVIKGLSTTTSNLTVSVSLAAVNSAFDGGKDGAEWQALIATRTNWTVAYA